MHRHSLAFACLLCLLAAPGSAAADGLLLQFRSALGTDGAPGRLYLFVDPGRVSPFGGTADVTLRSGRHHDLMGLPLYQRGGYVPDVVYQAASTRADTGQGNLARLCRENLLACAVGGVTLASAGSAPPPAPSEFGEGRLAP